MDNDPRRHIRGIIRGRIEEHKSNLDQVKDCIEQEFQRSLSPSDNAYIERKYKKYCSNFWLTEVTDILKELIDNKSNDIIREVFNSLDSIESLSDVPDLFKQQEYYELLIQHYGLLCEEEKTLLINRFKDECVRQTVAYIDTAEKEFRLLNAIVDFLNASQNLRAITDELKLHDFCRGELSVVEFLQRIIGLEDSTYGESLTVLQEAARSLQQERDLFFIDKFKTVINAYIKPTEIQERNIDNRWVIEVKGKKVVISEILGQIEGKFTENSDIEEVRFVGADILYIDGNFKKEIWHGKNIAILTKAIKIRNEVTWDVSGKDNDHSYSDNAGTGEDGHGKRGADGYPGESGGNVLVITQRIESPENFTIISNGGKGSKGQDGGNGEKGKDGKGIQKAEFDKKFSPGARITSRISVIETIINSIIKDSSEIERFWYTGTGRTINDVARDIRETIRLAASLAQSTSGTTLPSGNTTFRQSVFIEAMTSEGNEITISFECGGWFTCCQAFLLHKGSLGKPGGHGGEYGLGGQGGYAGEIIVRNRENSRQEFGIMKNTDQGEEGEKGKGGKYGNHGKNGLDMGYLDHSFWTKPEFRDQGKYKIAYYDGANSPCDRVWCPRNSKYAGIISSKENQAHTEYEERRSTRLNDNRQHSAQAARKKNISQDSIIANYSDNFSSVETDILQNLRSDLESTRQASQASSTNQQQQRNQTTASNVRRCVSSTSQRTHRT